MPISSEPELQRAYEGEAVASKYVGERFASEPHRQLHERQVAVVQRVMDRLQPSAALEIAPGPGRVTRDVRPAGRLVCLEFNAGMIEEGRKACGGAVEWVPGNAFELPFDQGEVDFVYSFRFIRHFQLDDRRRLYAQIQRVLRPGGALVFDAVNESVSRGLRESAPEEYPVYDELYRADQLRNELLQAGFGSPLLESVQRHYVWQHRVQTLVGPRTPWLNRLLVRALERLPGGPGLEWIVSCRRE
jgi:SAM-dependent methyltransferase